MTSCKKLWLPRIERYEALSSSERADVEQHLASCVDCKKVFSREAALSRLLRSLPPLEAPPVLQQRTLHLVHEAMASDRRGAVVNRISLPGFGNHRYAWQWLSAAAVVLILVSGVVFMPPSMKQTQDLSMHFLSRSWPEKAYLPLEDHYLSLGGMHERERAEVTEVIASLLSTKDESGHFSSRLYQSIDFTTDSMSGRPSTYITIGDSGSE